MPRPDDNSVEARLKRIEVRQEAVISAVDKVAEIAGTTHDLVAELVAWANRPSSDELPKLLSQLVEGLGRMSDTLGSVHDRVEALPEDVAKAVRGGG